MMRSGDAANSKDADIRPGCTVLEILFRQDNWINRMGILYPLPRKRKEQDKTQKVDGEKHLGDFA